MDPELVDRIYESSFVPELWPGILDELGRIADGTGGALFIAKADQFNIGLLRLGPVNARRVCRAPCWIFD